MTKYVTNGRNGQRAALYAGYGAGSASRGGRAAGVRASRLLKEPGSEACNRGSGALPLNPMRTRTPANESQIKRAEIASMIEARLASTGRGRSAFPIRCPGQEMAGRACAAGTWSVAGVEPCPIRATLSCEKCRRSHREYRREWRSDPWRAEWEREQSRRRRAERARPVWDPARDRERRRMEFDREWPEVPEVDAILEDPIVVQTVQERYWRRIARNFDAAWFG